MKHVLAITAANHSELPKRADSNCQCKNYTNESDCLTSSCGCSWNVQKSTCS